MSLINYLQLNEENFEVTEDSIIVYYKKGYITLSRLATKEDFLDLFLLYMTGKDAPGIVRE